MNDVLSRFRASLKLLRIKLEKRGLIQGSPLALDHLHSWEGQTGLLYWGFSAQIDRLMVLTSSGSKSITRGNDYVVALEQP
jgi:hypothetical protein